MEENLQQFLNIDILNFKSSFFKEIFGLLQETISKVDFQKTGSNSFIDLGPDVDIVLYLEGRDFSLSLSLRDDLFIINSTFIDYNFYPENNINEIKLIVNEIIQGNYDVMIGYNVKNKMCEMNLSYEDSKLAKFNVNKKYCFVWKQIHRYESINNLSFT